MSELFWPGDDRAGTVFSDQAYVDALVAVEAAWVGVDPSDWAPVTPVDLTSAADGNPVPALVALLRERTGRPDLHRGLTSQDVVDSALMVLLRDAVGTARADLETQVEVLVRLAAEHRETPMVARTLTQHAVPTTFGLKVATWLTGVLDAHDDLGRLTFPVQLGGAAGTLAAVVELGRDVAQARDGLAHDLGLSPAGPWHTTRRPVTRVGDALVACTDAWSRIANDVLTGSRPEVGELAEGSGGGSSTMPHKANPVLSVLVRRAALTTPQLAATLHVAAADQADERAPGGWHAEWDTLRTLTRRVVTAGAQTSDLLSGLRVHPDRMAATLAAAHDDVHAEQRVMADLAGHAPEGAYLGQAAELVDTVITRAQEALR